MDAPVYPPDADTIMMVNNNSSSLASRKKRKEEGRLQKRQRIEAAGGTRPREKSKQDVEKEEKKLPGKTATTKADTTEASVDRSRGKSLERKQQHREGGPLESPSRRSTESAFNNNRPHERTETNNSHTGRPPWKQDSNGRRISNNQQQHQQHRFGRVMEQVPCRNQPRYSTSSIALPGSVISNCQTRELRTHLVGQIARAATIYHVDEIIVFDDKLSTGMRKNNNRPRPQHHKRGDNIEAHGKDSGVKDKDHDKDDPQQEHQQQANRPGDETANSSNNNNDPHLFMARLLQYCECPQYLRRHFFPMHPSLQFAGLLPPIDAPHHVRADDHCRFREGVVLEDFKQEQHYGKQAVSSGSNTKCLVNCGIRGRPVEINARLQAGIRCTVELDPETAYGETTNSASGHRQQHQQQPNNNANNTKLGSVIHGGLVVSPSTPRERDGTYWGYTTRLARSIQAVFDECPYRNENENDNNTGYDLTIGTSERGDHMLEDMGSIFSLDDCSNTTASTTTPSAVALRRKKNFKHALIVFGGVAGIEECIDADESMKLSGAKSSKLFDVWVNICPYQGSRTIRTEEAVLITLARFGPVLFPTIKSAQEKRHHKKKQQQQQLDITPVEFTDESVSEESSSASDES